jgi:HAD superfamily hydrolase (TIGR01509 family)
MAPRAILFDFDGVIADTENHHVAAWQRTLAALGWLVPDEVARRAAEIDDRIFLRDLFLEKGIAEADADIDGWIRRKQTLIKDMLRDSPRLNAGVASFVARITDHCRCAVVSGTSRENIEAVLDASGLRGAFELIVAKEDVDIDCIKPDPTPYRIALDRLQVPAEHAVALEDSPTGIASAQAAGLRVIALGYRRPEGDWVGDAEYLPSFDPISAALARLGFEEPPSS